MAECEGRKYLAIGALASRGDCLCDVVADLFCSEALKVRARAGLKGEQKVTDRLFDLPGCCLRRELR